MLGRLPSRGGGELKKASEYQQHAEECRLLARNAVSPEHKAMLENMAQTWEGLAEERKKRLEKGIPNLDEPS
jgi:hypothetical protein